MWKISLAGLIVLFSVLVLAQDPQNLLVLQGATLIDGTGRPILRDAVILIEGERIREIARRLGSVPKTVPIIDLKGKWIIPGLIDAHVHFNQSGGLYTRPDVIDLQKRRPYDEELRWIRNRMPFTLERYLASGITGVVDVGGPMWNFETRDLAARTKNAPRVAIAGPLISTYAPPVPETPDPDIVKANSPEHARELVRAQLVRKPDLVKIWFIRRPQENFAADIAIVKAVIEESHKGGVRVAVHATELETAKAAVAAGADVLVHSVTDRLVDNEFLNMLKTRDVLYMSTLAVEENYREVLSRQVNLTDVERELGDPEVIATWSDLDRIPVDEIPGGIPRIPPSPPRPVAYENLVLLESAGVRIVGATDAGNIGTLHGPALHREFELMAEAGIRPADIIVSATKNAAAVMGRERDLGTLEKGKFADLVILNADPHADIRNARKIYKVMKAGQFYEPPALR
jgi:imidazolonepropionase-like amidohydrolase